MPGPRQTSEHGTDDLTKLLARRRQVHHVSGAQPVSVVQNLPFDLLDGAAELQHLTDGVGDWAGSLADDEQCAAGAARRALALLARLVCGVGGWGGSGMVGRVTGRL